MDMKERHESATVTLRVQFELWIFFITITTLACNLPVKLNKAKHSVKNIIKKTPLDHYFVCFDP